MIAKFEYIGKWKLPESGEWLNGTLSYDSDNGATLEVYGSFNSSLDRKSKEIIIGETINGEITLVDVWYRKTRSSSNGVVIGLYRPIIIIEGHHFMNTSDICFRQVKTGVFNLFQWFDKTGFNNDFDYSNGDYKISYNKIDPIPFELTDDCSGKIIFESPVKLEYFNNEINLREQCYFSLDYNSKTSYKDILEDISYLCDFMTLMCYEQSYPIWITFKDDDYSEDVQTFKRNKFIKCIYQNNNYNESYKLRRTGEHLVHFNEISDKFPIALKRWFSLFKIYPSVINLMLLSFREKNYFSYEKFMSTIKALESYHRNTNNNERIPISEYESLVEKILDSVELGNDDFQWLSNKIKGNEPSLARRIKELLRANKNEFIKENIKNVSKFSREITDTRNYFTHYDKKGKEKALKGKDLFDATLNAQGLLYSCILKELGLEEKDFVSGLKRHLYK